MSRKNFIILALLVSAGINLFFIGGIVSQVSNNGSREAGSRPFPPNISWVVREIDEASRDELQQILRQSYEAIRPIRGEMMGTGNPVSGSKIGSPFSSVKMV